MKHFSGCMKNVKVPFTCLVEGQILLKLSLLEKYLIGVMQIARLELKNKHCTDPLLSDPVCAICSLLHNALMRSTHDKRPDRDKRRSGISAAILPATQNPRCLPANAVGFAS